MPYSFLLGGARSGKSALAMRLAAGVDGPVVVLATAEALDEEMAARIREHRAARPAAWGTIETPLAIREAVEGIAEDATVLLDCLTLWVANALEAGIAEDALEADAAAVASALERRPARSVVVSNEVGLGIVPANELARTYRDALGRVNAIFAGHAAAAYLVVAGRGLPLEAVPLT